MWELLGMPDLYSARTILSEVAAEITYFHVAGGEIPETGVNLKINLLAEGKEEGIAGAGEEGKVEHA